LSSLFSFLSLSACRLLSRFQLNNERLSNLLNLVKFYSCDLHHIDIVRQIDRETVHTLKLVQLSIIESSTVEISTI
jgi:hypothetical protein